jgi:hypothetical protein
MTIYSREFLSDIYRSAQDGWVDLSAFSVDLYEFSFPSRDAAHQAAYYVKHRMIACGLIESTSVMSARVREEGERFVIDMARRDHIA